MGALLTNYLRNAPLASTFSLEVYGASRYQRYSRSAFNKQVEKEQANNASIRVGNGHRLVGTYINRAVNTTQLFRTPIFLDGSLYCNNF